MPFHPLFSMVKKKEQYMQYQKRLTLGLILVLLSTLSFAQERKVITIKASGHKDSIRHEIFIDEDMEWIDSTMGKVFIHKMPRHEKKARIVIKKSGFFRKGKIVIDFDPRSQEISHVTDNGKEVPENKFHKYQDYLEEAGDFADLEELHPRMEELEWKMQLSNLSDSEKVADIEAIILDLDALESDHAKLKKGQYASFKRIIELDLLTEIIQGILEDAGQTPPQKIEEIKIEDGKFILNGKEIGGKVGQKCIQAYANHSGHEFMGDKKISIHMQFD